MNYQKRLVSQRQGFYPLVVFLLIATPFRQVSAQTNNYFGTTGSLNGNAWNIAPGGPYTSPLNTTGGAIINFGNVATFNGGTITVAGINATANATLGTASGTISNQGNGIVTINVDSGATLDFKSQNITGSGTAGYIKNGGGVLALNGNTYGGGFTLNTGTVVMRGVNAMGAGSLVLNGGTVASDGTLTLSNKYPGGISINGNIQFGDTTGVAVSTANLTFTNSVTLGSSTRTLTIGNNGTTTFSGPVSGSAVAGLTIDTNAGSTGTIALSGSNTYSGQTTVNNGNLQVSGGNAISDSGAVVIANSSTATLTVSGSETIGSLSGGGALGGKVVVDSGNVLTVAGSSTTSFDGIISGNGGLSMAGSGTLTLSADQTFNGPLNISSGVLNVTGRLASIPITVSGGTYTIGQTDTVGSVTLSSGTINGTGTLGGSSYSLTNSGTISVNLGGGSSSLTKSGAGTVTLSGANTYTGGTTVSDGVLNVLGTMDNSGSILINGGTYNVGINDSVGTVTVSSGTISGAGTLSGTSYNLTDSGTISAQLGGSGSLVKSGVGNTTISSISSYTGATAINDGTLTINGSTAAASTVTIASAGTLAGSGTVNGVVNVNGGVINKAGGSIIGGITTTGNSSVGGSFSATGGMTVSTGTTTVSGTISGGDINVNSAGELKGSATINNATTIAGSLSPGNSPGLMTYTNGLSLLSGSTFNWELDANSNSNPGVDFDKIIVSGGNLSIASGSLSDLIFGGTVSFADSFWSSNRSWLVFDNTGLGTTTATPFTINSISGGGYNASYGTFSWNVTSGDVFLNFNAATAVPEPTSLATVALLGLGGAWYRRRKNSNKSGIQEVISQA